MKFPKIQILKLKLYRNLTRLELKPFSLVSSLPSFGIWKTLPRPLWWPSAGWWALYVQITSLLYKNLCSPTWAWGGHNLFESQMLSVSIFFLKFWKGKQILLVGGIFLHNRLFLRLQISLTFWIFLIFQHNILCCRIFCQRNWY